MHLHCQPRWKDAATRTNLNVTLMKNAIFVHTFFLFGFSIKLAVKISGRLGTHWYGKYSRVQCSHKGAPAPLIIRRRLIPQVGTEKTQKTTFCQQFVGWWKLPMYYVLHARLHRIRVTTRPKPALAKGNIWERMFNESSDFQYFYC